MNWRESKAHRAAFIRLKQRIFGDLKSAPLSDEWDVALGEPNAVAVQRWIDEGCYRRCGLAETLALTLTVQALQEMLKERGLPTKGKKADLIDCLIAADKQAIDAFVTSHPVWLLTNDAIRLQASFRSEIAHEEAIARQYAYELLQVGDVGGACDVWQRHDEGKVFSAAKSAIGFSGSAGLAAFHRSDIERFFAIGPKQVAEELALETLFGRGPTSPETRKLYTKAAFVRDMLKYQKSDQIVGVEIRESPTGRCEACLDVVGRWPKSYVISIPYVRCVNEVNCTCSWAPIFADEVNVAPWRIPLDMGTVSPADRQCDSPTPEPLPEKIGVLGAIRKFSS